MKADLPKNEQSRLQALQRYRILDTLPEKAYDDITLLASKMCSTPIALVSLIDSDRQWFKSKQGLDVSETHRDHAFCAHAIHHPKNLLIVPDTHQDKRFTDNVLVTGAPFIRFYAGAPLVTTSGDVLGTLCVIDRQPREFSPEEEETLGALARLVITQLELRLSIIEAEKSIQTRIQMEASMRESEERFQAFMANTPAVTFIKNKDGKYIFVNNKFFNVFNKKKSEVLGKTDQDLWPSETAAILRENDKMILNNNMPMSLEESTPNADGSLSYWLSCKFPLHDAQGNKLLAGLSLDITDRKYYEIQMENYQRRLETAITELERLSSTDALSGLKNKGAFSKQLDDEIARAKRYNLPLSLLFLDIDKFKEFNDTFGHPAGDEAIQQVSRIIEAHTRPSDYVARIGGEEFAVIFPCTDVQGAFIMAERLRRGVESSLWTKRHVTVSIGVAEMSDLLENSTNLTKAADQALYEAKRNGRNRVIRNH